MGSFFDDTTPAVRVYAEPENTSWRHLHRPKISNLEQQKLYLNPLLLEGTAINY